MEVRVYVDGVPRVVCGVTQETTCHEVVLALAQALGQAGRYTLREKFKDFERGMMPDERLLETLEKYSEQAKEVQLTLLHNAPSFWDEMGRAKASRYQPCPPLRRKDAGSRVRRGSGSLSLHRRSLPPLSCVREETEKKQDTKRAKRKSLSLVEEAWEWLESLGKGKVYSTAGEKDKKNCSSLEVTLPVCKENLSRGSKGGKNGHKSLKADSDHQTSCCMGNQTRAQDAKKTEEAKSDPYSSSCSTAEDEKNLLRETIIYQLVHLQDLQTQMTCTDKQIVELEEKWRVQKAEQEACDRTVEEEEQQIQFWENELKAEEVYEQELQRQFLEMRAKAVETKAKLKEYHRKIQQLNFFGAPNAICEGPRTDADTASESSVENPQWSMDGNTNRKFPLLRDDCNPSPHALVPPHQIKERRPTGPTELREWWMRWSEAQSSQTRMKTVIHRSELTIYLGSTKV
ncbi:uncharacterized protein rassf11 [Pholidichthys leucotaenia]